MKKKVLIAILIVIVLAIVAIGVSVFLDLKQEEKLKTELAEINELSNSETTDRATIAERLERTVTKGNYAIIEQAFKQYLKDDFDNMLQIAEILNDERITTILTVDNYLYDGKDFTQTKNYLTTTKETLETCKANYTEFFTEEKAMSYIQDKGLDSYYTDFYKQELVGDIENQKIDTTVEDSIDEIIEILNISEEVINLLSENPDSWQIEGDTIVFNREDLSNEYDELVSRLL